MATADFAYTIMYVPDVSHAIAFYEAAFGMSRRFVADDGSYGELNTGTITLSFASESLGDKNLPGGYQRHAPDALPFACEVAFATAEVEAVVRQAVTAGGSLIAEPVIKRWGQTVAYVRDPDGLLIEICTPVGG